MAGEIYEPEKSHREGNKQDAEKEAEVIKRELEMNRDYDIDEALKA